MRSWGLDAPGGPGGSSPLTGEHSPDIQVRMPRAGSTQRWSTNQLATTATTNRIWDHILFFIDPRTRPFP